MKLENSSAALHITNLFHDLVGMEDLVCMEDLICMEEDDT